MLRGCPTVTQHSLNTAAAAMRATRTADNTIINTNTRQADSLWENKQPGGAEVVGRSAHLLCAWRLQTGLCSLLLQAACTPAPDAPLEEIRAQLVHKTWTDFSKSYNMAGDASWLGCKSLPAVRTRPLSHRSSSSSSSHALHPSLYRS